MFRPKEGSEELGDWKDPYTRSLVVVQDLKLADKVVWYAYRFPRYFIKNKDYCEDILQEILFELSQMNFFDIYSETISKISRRVVYNFLAKVCLPVSGYRNFRSWLNRKMFLAKQKEKDEEVVTELESAVKEIERIWNEKFCPDEPAKAIYAKYPLIEEFAESGLSKKSFCLSKHIGEARLNKIIGKAREEYLWLSQIV